MIHREIIDISNNLDEARATVLLLRFNCDLTLAGNTIRDDGKHFFLEFGDRKRRPMRFTTALPAVRQLKRFAAARIINKKACTT
jgi:hypothetical protein